MSDPEDWVNSNSPVSPEEFNEEFDELDGTEDAKRVLAGLVNQGFIDKSDVNFDPNVAFGDVDDIEEELKDGFQ